MARSGIANRLPFNARCGQAAVLVETLADSWLCSGSGKECLDAMVMSFWGLDPGVQLYVTDI